LERHKSATGPFRSDSEWQDKLVFSTIQTFGNAATIISQMKWSGFDATNNAHMKRSAEKLSHILGWLEDQLDYPIGKPNYPYATDIF
jgi:hypothetical protein